MKKIQVKNFHLTYNITKQVYTKETGDFGLPGLICFCLKSCVFSFCVPAYQLPDCDHVLEIGGNSLCFLLGGSRTLQRLANW